MKNFKLTTKIIQILVLIFSISACNNNKKLQIYGQREAKITKLTDGTTQVDTIYKTIPNFKFLNQDSAIVTQEVIKNKIYVADFFFTSCSTICPVMHRNLLGLYQDFKENSNLMFISHTIDFKYDKPSILKNYAKKLGVNINKWQFLYGTKDSVYHLAEHDYLVAVKEDNTAPDGYIHQGWLVLVDKQKRIRGAYDGTKTEQVAQLKKDITILLAEPEQQ